MLEILLFYSGENNFLQSFPPKGLIKHSQKLCSAFIAEKFRLNTTRFIHHIALVFLATTS